LLPPKVWSMMEHHPVQEHLSKAGTSLSPTDITQEASSPLSAQLALTHIPYPAGSASRMADGLQCTILSGTASPWLCPRAIATGKGNRLGDRISFQCQTNLDLIGSSQRVCMLDGEWSDTQPSCRGMHFKDTLFFQRISSFEVPIKFSVISYASQSKTIVDIGDVAAEDVEMVLELMEDTHFADHGNATGTNIHAALNAVYQMMINEERIMKDEWNKVRHAIILLTDGKSNLGGSPKIAVSHIEELVNVRNNRKDYLGGEIRLGIKRRIDHELYNIRAKTAQGIQEFYDYDISLIELEKPVTFGGRIRPICLPCTEGASRALKKKPGTTCRDH
ncbi:hypothetical protein E2320_014588, partial [Naja naja]